MNMTVHLDFIPTLAEIDAALMARRARHASNPLTVKVPLALAEDAEDLPALVRLAARLSPALRRAFLAAAESARSQIDLEAVAGALMSGHHAEAEVQARLDLLQADLGTQLDPVLRQGFLEGAGVAHGELAAAGIGLRFDLVNPAAVAWAERRTAELVVAVTDSTREAIRGLIRDSVAGGDDVRATARALRDVVGLDPRRASAVEAFRTRLEDAGAANLDRRVERYAAAQLRDRATVIARTETLTAEHRGLEALWDEAYRQGLLDRATTRRTWIVTDDDRLDAECEALDGAEAELDGSFPGGVSGPPLHPQCRCSEGLVFERGGG